MTPSNLTKIIPPDLGFNIVSGGEGAMYKGIVVTYDIDSIFRMPFTWVTEITEVEEKKKFVDFQRSGLMRTGITSIFLKKFPTVLK